jgi:hypothetical protein
MSKARRNAFALFRQPKVFTMNLFSGASVVPRK